MHLQTVALVALLGTVRPVSSNTVVETKNYIDTISGYHDLSTCAEEVLSTIVRAQSSGCGDNGALTSYSCFCTDSSSLFSYEISSAILVSCESSVATAQASSALKVFSGYCALGVEAGLSTTVESASTQTATSTALPAASATTPVPSATSTSTPSANSTSSSGSSKTTAIAVGIIVPLAVIALGLIGWLLYRKGHQFWKPSNSQGKNSEIKDRQNMAVPGVPEMPTFEQHTYELPENGQQQFTSSSTAETPAEHQQQQYLAHEAPTYYHHPQELASP